MALVKFGHLHFPFSKSSSVRLVYISEAEYTYRLRKDIIPLLLQPGYDPDGWLGIMVGTRLYFDFTTAENIPTQMPRLLREIGTRGSINKRPALSVRSPPSSESFLEGELVSNCLIL